jgi:hypothetical protein
MKRQLAKATVAILSVLVVFSTISVCLAEDQEISYQLLNQPSGNVAYELNVVIPQSLLEYYMEKSHNLPSTSDFASFTTPYALKPIADCLWQIYNNDEDYVNGVLMLVHQITYQETGPEMYPVETMAEGKGDCDLFSFIAASILEAGGIDVVLLYYENQNHMNIGIHLPSSPKDARDTVYYVVQNGVKYYIAECTGGNWKEGWRVGECPPDLKQVTSQVITLENAEQVAPGQVSASFTAMEPSTLSLEISPIVSLQNSAITIRGQLAPEEANKNVTLYASVNDSPWEVIGTTVTQADGSFEYVWATNDPGLCAVQASWVGDSQYTGAISPTRSTTVIPVFVFALIALAVLAAVVGAVAVLMSKHMQQHSPNSGDPGISTF